VVGEEKVIKRAKNEETSRGESKGVLVVLVLREKWGGEGGELRRAGGCRADEDKVQRKKVGPAIRRRGKGVNMWEPIRGKKYRKEHWGHPREQRESRLLGPHGGPQGVPKKERGHQKRPPLA